ncbi:hypothetical protein [Aliiroseovarius sp. 2305UL8-7]|uniref:hypothetical protein n=1 Tax=Aliiroseovarius conchicola TaxID=3121637 RepID=UPI0035273FEA
MFYTLSKWLTIAVVVMMLLLHVRQWVSGRGYAKELFDGVVDYSEILHARRHHFSEHWGAGCTYALVALSQPTDPFPPEKIVRGPFGAFATENWQQTPAPEETMPGSGETSLMNLCESLMPRKIWVMFDRALYSQGSYYWGDHEKINIYSPMEGFAVQFRYGD